MTEHYNCPVANWYSATIQEVSVAAVDEKCLTDWIQASQCRNNILLFNCLGYSLSFVDYTKLSTLIIQLKGYQVHKNTIRLTMYLVSL